MTAILIHGENHMSHPTHPAVRNRATAMSSVRARAALLVLTGLGAAACGGDAAGPGDGGGPGTLSVSPASSALKYPGDTVRLVAGGSAAATATLQWTTSDPSVITVSGDGLATAAGYGSATVSVRLADQEATASLRVIGDTSLAFLEGAWTTLDDSGPDGLSDTGLLVVAEDQGALRGVWRGTLGGDPVEVVTVSVRRGSGWAMARADGARGTFAVMDGAVEPGRITLDSGTKLGGALRERTVLSDFSAAGFRWTVEESDDGGSTWNTRWTQTLQRTGPALHPAVMEAPSPACAAAEYAQFDFWRGDWTVTVPSGSTAGSNLIHGIAGCGIQENWRDASSGGGVSLNMYDPRSGKWAQFYVASTGGLIELYGSLRDGAMDMQTLSGVDRVTWSLLEDGRVRQHWVRSGSTFFDGYYRRR